MELLACLRENFLIKLPTYHSLFVVAGGFFVFVLLLLLLFICFYVLFQIFYVILKLAFERLLLTD